MTIKKTHPKNKDKFLDHNGTNEVSAADIRFLLDNPPLGGDILNQSEVPEPPNPPEGTVISYVTAVGVSPNKLVSYNIKHSNGRVAVVSTVIV